MSDYPGYKSPCNGCGLCCLTVPCAVSEQFGLWRHGRCVALRRGPGRYWCDVIVQPRTVSTRLAKFTKAARLDAIGAGHGCDHRAAWSMDEALRLLAVRNLIDELTESERDTYPRAACLHHDGRVWLVHLDAADSEPTLQEIQFDLPPEAPVPLSEWRP